MKMKLTRRVEDLPVPLLDYFVAQAEKIAFMRTEDDVIHFFDEDGKVYGKAGGGRMFVYSPSTDWRLGGPIIERHRISVQAATSGWKAEHDGDAIATGETALIATMRTRVIMHFGRVVEVELEE